MSHVSRGRSLRGWVRELTGGRVLLGEYLGVGSLSRVSLDSGTQTDVDTPLVGADEQVPAVPHRDRPPGARSPIVHRRSFRLAERR